MRIHFLLISTAAMVCSIPACFGMSDVSAQLLNLVPAGTRVISGIDVAAAKTSPFGQYMLGQINTAAASDNGFQQFVEQTGFDPRSDIQQLIFASTGTASQPNFTVLALATYDKNRMEAAAKTQGATLQTFQGVDLILYKTTRHNGQAKQSGIAFLDTGVLAGGDAEVLENLIANRANPPALDPTLLNSVGKMSSTNDAWFVSIVPGTDLPFKMSGVKQQQQGALAASRVLQSVLSSDGGIQFGQKVTISADALTQTQQDATSLSDGIRLLASMAQMQAPANDQRAAILINALNSLTLTSTGNSVHLGLAFSETDVEQLAQLRSQSQAFQKNHSPNK